MSDLLAHARGFDADKRPCLSPFLFVFFPWPECYYFFQQEGSLCAQHALNALLQGNYFTAIDLAELARQLDETEKARMTEGGETEEFRKFVEVRIKSIPLGFVSNPVWF